MADLSSLDPDRLQRFIAELVDAGFDRVDDDRFEGPVPDCLTKFTDAKMMTIIVKEPWPYRQPSIRVDGIHRWHSTDGHPCLWQSDDNTKSWVTLAGILARIEEWATAAEDGFSGVGGAALDPHLYFNGTHGGMVGVDVEGLIAGRDQDGQHERVTLDLSRGFPVLVKRRGDGEQDYNGRWFYRSEIAAPPKDLTTFEAQLTKKQLGLMHADLARDKVGVFMLAWPTQHGTACLILRVQTTMQGPKAEVYTPTPTSQVDRLRRGGPDAEHLAGKRIVVFGCGAIGSHVVSLLARCGATSIVPVDGDLLTPAGQVRHAFDSVGVPKVDEAVNALARFEWATIEPVREMVWDLDGLRNLLDGAALCVDATGNSLFAELLSRIALELDVAFLTVALFRGGRVCRVRRQAAGDPPIVGRTPHWRYPEIPAGADPELDFVGAETGCAAAIHNASPSAVLFAAATAMQVIADLATRRGHYPAEVTDVLEPIEPPMHRLGRVQPTPPPVLLTDNARATMAAAATKAHPAETGGVLVGARDADGAVIITDAVELPPAVPSPGGYQVPAGQTQAAVDAIRDGDERKEYVGEWHSHPSDQPASPTDTATMVKLYADPNTGDPVLCVLRPVNGTFAIDAYIADPPALVRVPMIDAGPLPAKEL